jgi:hypothetical protein
LQSKVFRAKESLQIEYQDSIQKASEKPPGDGSGKAE